MREIKFKAKRVSDGEWVEGSLIQDYIHHQPNSTITQGGCIYNEVTPESVCQFTGLNHIEVYYDDILELTYKGKSKMLQVSFSEENQCLIFLYLDETKYNNRYTYEKYDRAWWNYNCKNGNIRRIGNIHDKIEQL